MGRERVGADERVVKREDAEQEQRGVSSGAMCAGVVQVRHVRVGAGEWLVGREGAEQEQRGARSGAANVGVVHVRCAGVALVGVSVCGDARGIANLGDEIRMAS